MISYQAGVNFHHAAGIRIPSYFPDVDYECFHTTSAKTLHFMKVRMHFVK